MWKAIIFLYLILGNFFLYGQDEESITVKKGKTLLDYIPPSERFLYSEFKTGKVIFKTTVYQGIKLNYNYLNGQIEFQKNSDTLAISNTDDLKLITIAEDTFYYDKGYIQLIKSGPPKIGFREAIEFREYMKKDGYGTAGSAGARTSYGSMGTSSSSYKLTADQDLVYARIKKYFILSPEGDFDIYRKKNVLKIFPENKDKIKSFIKSNKIDFNSREDLLKLADFLEGL